MLAEILPKDFKIGGLWKQIHCSKLSDNITLPRNRSRLKTQVHHLLDTSFPNLVSRSPILRRKEEQGNFYVFGTPYDSVKVTVFIFCRFLFLF
jgi:hypothetical protein